MTLLSTRDLAELLGGPSHSISEYWVAEQVRRGRFPHLRVGRRIKFTDEHVKQILEVLEVPASSPIRIDRPTGAVANGARLGGMTSRSRRYHERKRAAS